MHSKISAGTPLALVHVRYTNMLLGEGACKNMQYDDIDVGLLTVLILTKGLPIACLNMCDTAVSAAFNDSNSHECQTFCNMLMRNLT